MAASLGVTARVHFVGFQDDVTPFLSALSLYVHPARMEGFGIAVVEAMTVGKAVVATRVGGLPEVVDHGRTGLLVPPNRPEELSAAIPGDPALVIVAKPGEDGALLVGDGNLSEPGRYAIVCFIPTGVDPDAYLTAVEASGGGAPAIEGAGPPHAFNGMYQEVTVNEADE